MYGVIAISVAILAVVTLLASVLQRGLPAFTQTFMTAEIFLDPEALDPSGNRDPEEISKVLTFAYAPADRGFADRAGGGAASG